MRAVSSDNNVCQYHRATAAAIIIAADSRRYRLPHISHVLGGIQAARVHDAWTHVYRGCNSRDCDYDGLEC